MDSFNLPNTEHPFTLFEYSIRKIISLGLMNENNTHQVWANYIFSYIKDASERSRLMSIVKHEYSAYFESLKPIGKYSFCEDKIRKSFPQFFGCPKNTDLFDHILNALDAECEEQRSPKNRESYRVASCDRMSILDNQFIYKSQLIIDEGDDPHFTEGMPFVFKTNISTYNCEVVEFDYANGLLFFSSTRDIYLTSNCRVMSDATMNIMALMKLIGEISQQGLNQIIPLFKFITGETENLTKIKNVSYPPYLDDILRSDASQYTAFKAALRNDITFIWGPPGTGKSYTLSAIIMALKQMSNERTAVCCLSNVAVDQLVRKVINFIDVYEPNILRGELYRAGRTQDVEILQKSYLYPDDESSKKLKFKIKLYSSQLDKYKKSGNQYTDEAIKAKAKLKEAREKLKEHTDYLIDQVKVVFSTIANFVINPRLKNAVFDNLIIDEASMLALPQLIALARKVTKRIILVGDFQQLSPITVAGIPILKDNVFKLCGIDINSTRHVALHQLLNQRRSNPKLVDIINKSFYNNRLKAINNKFDPIVACEPYSDCVVGMYDVNNGIVRFTKGGTRQNIPNAEATMSLLDIFSNDHEATFSIGIITPYKGQVALLKAMFIKRAYGTDFQERVRIGTVHTFQGSECEVIIFDMVDCSNFEKGKPYPGKIYGGLQGEQLLNVAISRAKHKLIIICSAEYLAHYPGGQLSERSWMILKEFLKARSTKAL